MKFSSELMRILFSTVAVLILSVLDTIELSYGRNLPSVAMDGRSEILLSGNDWELGSFPMGEGERQNAFAFNFAGPDFRRVPVPADPDDSRTERDGVISSQRDILNQ